ncbi:hypothetical protein LQ953_12110 [Sphingomonas sp. IC-56]|uniref:hypothetical protein n=1 Tax=Sphingomonas sp. IC-56 TaxID=2898529 RepID=UPI001E4FCD1F|nr:hypothetical protein [Sphingomonas sp. IC-56]MCD2324759.1 hypothetical protein [Sphingomonas sp. IC-56]
MGTDTPQVIDDAVLAFCVTVAPGVPEYVDVVPGEAARIAYCFDNAAAAVARGGGEVAYGWAIWRWPGRYFEAEHHGIWRSPEGRLIDVTPMLYGQTRTLFLSDPQAVFDSLRYRANVLGAEPGNAVAEEYVAVARERAEILNAYGEPGVDHAITPRDQARLDAITPRWMALYAALERGEGAPVTEENSGLGARR